MITIPNFRKGDSVNWETELPDKYQNGWTLQWAIRGENQLDITATQTPPDMTFYSTITTTQSATLTPGDYWWIAAVTKNEERITLADGEIIVEPDLFSIESAYDGRTSKQKLLDEVEQAVSLIANGARASYKINDREFTYQNLPDLTRWRDKLRIEVKREKHLQKIRQGLADQRIIGSRFKVR